MVESVHPRSHLILLVDDFEDAREMYAEYLSFRGYRVVTAVSGEEAVEIAHRERPAVILMDLRMPGMTGTAAMRVLRGEPAFSGVPIVAFTAHALDDEQEAAMCAGFDYVIAKPCFPDELVRMIEAFLRLSRPNPHHDRMRKGRNSPPRVTRSSGNLQGLVRADPLS